MIKVASIIKNQGHHGYFFLVPFLRVSQKKLSHPCSMPLEMSM